MEDWATVLISLGGAAIVALFAWFGNRQSIKAADKRFESERKRNIRDEPLRRFRKELALMSAKMDKLIRFTHMQHFQADVSEEYAAKILVEALDDWAPYSKSWDFEHALFMIDDDEVLIKAKEIRTKYSEVYHLVAQAYPNNDSTKSELAMEHGEILKQDVTELQGLVNKKLEQL